MANRFPLTLNKTTKKIEEIPAGETLDISGCGIVGGTNAEFSGTVEAQEYLIAGQPVSQLLDGNWNTLANKPTALSQFVNDVGFITQDTDAQNLGLVNSTLSIERGNSIDLSSLFALDFTNGIISIGGSDTEVDLSGALAAAGQTLSLNGNLLSISGGNDVDLSLIQSADTLDDVLGRGNESLFPITVGAVNAGQIIQTGTGVATITSASNIRFDAAGGVGEIDLGGSKVVNFPSPTVATDIVNKAYVDDRSFNGDYMHFGQGANDQTVPLSTAWDSYFKNVAGNDIEVSFQATRSSREVLIELNAAIEDTSRPNVPASVVLVRLINGVEAAREFRHVYTFPPFSTFPYGTHMMFLDVYQGVNPGDTISYKILNNMGDSQDTLTIRYSICGDTFGAREI
jgi:hypothetical protein